MSQKDKAGNGVADPEPDDTSTLGYDLAEDIVCKAAGVDPRNLARTLAQLGLNGIAFQGTVFNGIRDAGYVIEIDLIPDASSTRLADVVAVIQNATQA